MPSLTVSIAVTWVRTIVQFCGLTPGGQGGATSFEVVVPSSMTSADANAGASAARSPPVATAAMRKLFMCTIEHECAAAVAPCSPGCKHRRRRNTREIRARGQPTAASGLAEQRAGADGAPGLRVEPLRSDLRDVYRLRALRTGLLLVGDLRALG